jgi:hypothetical protein
MDVAFLLNSSSILQAPKAFLVHVISCERQASERKNHTGLSDRGENIVLLLGGWVVSNFLD